MAVNKTSALLAIVLLAVLCGVPRETEAAKLAISWPKWFWCFPDCVIGETCFYRVYRYCRRELPWVIPLNCVCVGLDWCDLTHITPLDRYGLPPSPPHGKFLEEVKETISTN
ncbi:hypothetical protein HPP92_013075 [Vanilla planifolia]|uniref:Uncharacterized protein n=1 Tax=Vanilla planifolia TaxID=51239 RepID=A0A835QRP3_VANPL|nr:hypothetical protein HPP92_013542 [Vanilla planifolia]KAG0478356.1 hypothetical protein HPP92_013075 [Vanilla planifolia]